MRFKIEDSLVDTDKASAHWNEATYFDGNNHRGEVTKDQYTRQTLYRSAKGRYYIVTTSAWQGTTPSAEFVSKEDAAKWLMLCNHPLPEEFADLDVVE